MSLEEKIDSTKDQVAGKAKEAEGQVTGDKSKEAEGKAQGILGK
ncbi:CsbD family protein, partial [Leuconostoc citreum]